MTSVDATIVTEVVDAAEARVSTNGHRRSDPRSNGGPSSTEDDGQRRVDLIPASDVRPEQTEWLLQDLIPLGGVTLLVSQEGTGKTGIAVDVAARATRGQLAGQLKDCPVGIVFATAEDSWSRTLVPRFMAAGADLKRVHFVTVDGLAGGLSVPGDLDRLTAAMRKTNSRLLVLDPLGAHLHGSLDTHRDASVRQALAPLAARMDEIKAAAIGVMHWSKAPTTVALDRVNGSRAFTAAARSVLVLGEDPNDQSTKLLVLAKSNLGRLDVPALGFRVEGRSVADSAGGPPIETCGIAWLGERPGIRASDLLGLPPDDEARSEQEEITELLLEMTVSGRVAVDEARKALKNAGYSVSDSSLARARRRAGLATSKPDGLGGKRYYYRPTSPVTEVADSTDRTAPTRDNGSPITSPVKRIDSTGLEPSDGAW